MSLKKRGDKGKRDIQGRMLKGTPTIILSADEPQRSVFGAQERAGAGALGSGFFEGWWPFRTASVPQGGLSEAPKSRRSKLKVVLQGQRPKKQTGKTKHESQISREGKQEGQRLRTRAGRPVVCETA